jgi:hypothetical protein
MIVMRVLALRRTASVHSLILAAWLVVCGPASAETLTLNDGSVIQGDIKSLQNDVYTVETNSLGTVRVRKQDVRSIDHTDDAERSLPASRPGGGSPAGQADLQAMQSRMMQSPDLFSMIEALQNDPEVQAVLSDPETMRALASGDIATLMSHPGIIALTTNAQMREIIEEVR